MPRILPSVLAAAIVAPLLRCQDGEVPPMPTAEYQALTNPHSAATNFNIETVRGLLLRADGLFALNTHASTIVYHNDLQTPEYEAEWPTVGNPVAIAEANGNLLVVGGSTWSLVEHDPGNGRILRHVQLAAEPADIVVYQNKAYVACQGDNVVVRIDLQTFQEDARYSISSQRPRFLYLDELAVPPMIYVAPSLSGNNTTLSRRTLGPGAGMDQVRAVVVDLDATNAAGTDLPDEDLFQIDPSLSGNVAAVPVLHNAGTLLTEHARNPVTLKYWMLSTESLNAVHNSEDQHRGVFANAQLAIADNLGTPGRPEPGQIIDLDLPIGGGAKAPNTSMSFPFALAFHDTGIAAIASSTSDLITLTNEHGTRLLDLPITQVTRAPQMPPQQGPAIPRDLWWDSPSNSLIVHCWGWNKVLVYNLSKLSDPPWWFDLGPDPLPVAAQRGRSIWYDARRTSDPGMPGAVTCNTCHPAGGMDLLGWGLSDSMKDIKDLMVTQSLMSISDTFPYHWRGERNLDHFNDAFTGLLGHSSKLGDSELNDFEAFVFSLQAPANPAQHIDRVLDGLEAQRGQQTFLNKDDVLAGFTCAGCHSMPAGTNGDRVTEVFVGIAGTGSLDVSHLRQLWHKDQGAVDVIIPSTSGPIHVQRARGGFGIAHEGINVDLSDFIRPGPFQITAQDQVDMTAFVRQFDQGIAPAAHRAWLIDRYNKAAMEPVVASILLAQSGKGWVDIAAIGHEDVGGTVRELRWAFDASTGLFTCHDSSLAPRPWDVFFTQITGPANYLLVGLPPANAKRFALDPDNDGLTDAEEAANVTMARNRDSDGDGYDDGYEVAVMSDPNVNNVPIDTVPPTLLPGTQLVRDHSTATFAKFYAQFNEPVTWELQALDMNESPPTVVSVTRSTALQREAMIHMHELYPSTEGIGDVRNYAPRLIIRDPRGNPTTITGAAFATTNQLLTLPRFDLTIDDLQHQTPPVKNNGTMTVNATVRVRYKAEVGGVVPLAGRVVVAHVLRRPQGSHVWSVSSDPTVSAALMVPTFDLRFEDDMGVVTINPYAALPGDFLLSTPTDAAGMGTFQFSHSGLSTGDDVRISIVAILEPSAGLANTFELGSLQDWDLPTTQGGATPTVPTARDLRGLTSRY